jgi:hypothetical protein
MPRNLSRIKEGGGDLEKFSDEKLKQLLVIRLDITHLNSIFKCIYVIKCGPIMLSNGDATDL